MNRIESLMAGFSRMVFSEPCFVRVGKRDSKIIHIESMMGACEDRCFREFEMKANFPF